MWVVFIWSNEDYWFVIDFYFFYGINDFFIECWVLEEGYDDEDVNVWIFEGVVYGDFIVV